MHVVQLNFFLDRARTPRDILRDWHSLLDIALAARAGGARVSVVQACATEAHFGEQGVDFHFVVPEGGLLAGTTRFAALLQRLAPDVAHVHGLGFPHEVMALRGLAPRLPVLLQDHADGVPRFWRRAGFRRGLAPAAAVSFCARAQADPFRRAGLLDTQEVCEIPESTSTFSPGDRDEARRDTGLHGDPALLWVGHLDANKDPLTVLEGVSLALRDLPNLRLWMCFGTAPLQPAVEARITRDPALRERVHLLGRVPHAHVQALMRAADLFVLGSHREGSSFSLIEALATGLTPVVTDIPSLRALTGGAAVGALWPCGDARACARALVQAASALGAGSRAAVRAHFDAQLSHVAIGRRLADVYARIAQRASLAPTAA
jgi:glycosyltransferase involved in cell wall biosynthesis